MKKISIVIPCFNEVENVRPITEAVVGIMEDALARYDYEIIFIDNSSQDGTREQIRELCRENKRIKAIFNVTNFGQFNSPFHAMCQTTGDCTICLCCDFQDPPELIPRFVEEWEKGAGIVIGIKTSSKESKPVYFLRTVYYKMMRKFSTVKMIEHFTGFGLYDKSFISILKQLDDPTPFLRGIVAEYGSGFSMAEIAYEQPLRKAGRTHNNLSSLYDAAMLSVTSYTKLGMRLAALLGAAGSMVSVIFVFVYLVLKLIYGNGFQAGHAPVVLAIAVLGSLQLFFIGLLGEYMMNVNARVIHRPLVVEEERLNFEPLSKPEKENL